MAVAEGKVLARDRRARVIAPAFAGSLLAHSKAAAPQPLWKAAGVLPKPCVEVLSKRIDIRLPQQISENIVTFRCGPSSTQKTYGASGDMATQHPPQSAPGARAQIEVTDFGPREGGAGQTTVSGHRSFPSWTKSRRK